MYRLIGTRSAIDYARPLTEIDSIATLGSHCALQVLRGAKEEGFRGIILVERRREALYRRFRFIDDFILVECFGDIVKKGPTETLQRLKSLLIPHGTLISQVGIDKIENELKIPIFGNRFLLRWEADRELKEKLMKKSGLKTPRTFSSPENIDSLSVVKLWGAEGGRGYFLASDKKSFKEGLEACIQRKVIKPGEANRLYIQEYVIGVPVYLQYFYSPLNEELELLGVDRRYETTVDALGRIPAAIQAEVGHSPSYMVVGNIPLVLRESLLDEVYKIGENFVKTSSELIPPGVIGPFCIEGVYREEGEFVSFEFSARIVAGTNLFIQGSPYSQLIYEESMSMGRRIAREVRVGIQTDEVEKLVT